MTELSCNGSEMDISACPYKGWGSTQCRQKDDVGLECRKLSYIYIYKF